MDQFRILGGAKLEGRLKVSGAKNSALPCMAATLLTGDPVTLRNVPYVRDLITMRRLLEDLGAQVLVPELHTHRIETRTVDSVEAPYELVKTMRASVLVLGPLVARFGKARVSLPGGCAIGQRPIDLHLKALEKMGARIELSGGAVEASAERLRGADIEFETVTVTGTENVLMAATLAEGTTRIFNAALEPEIVDLADLLTKMGARIAGAGTSVIAVEGVRELRGADHRIIPDRIEAGTFAIAAAISAGSIDLEDCRPEHLAEILSQLRKTGVVVESSDETTISIRPAARLTAVSVSTEVYPGFATDMQAQYMALMTQAAGDCEVTETIFENRFMHASELQRLGANVRTQGNTAFLKGPSKLTGARIMASDLRASASLVLAGLVADGETLIDRVYHIDRGYERIEEKLRSVGARIDRLKSDPDPEAQQGSD
jgi:UDP-N-acetylglucosamine 1-carboxyvinyltransferase